MSSIQDAAIDAAWLAWWRRDHALGYHQPPFHECPICQPEPPA